MRLVTVLKRVLVVMLLITASMLAAPARAGGDAHSVPDSLGFFQMMQGAVGDNHASWGVVNQTGRRFAADIELGDVSCPVTGTISESLQLSAAGDCGTSSPGSRVAVHGEWIADVERPEQALLRWTLTDALGGSVQGDLVLLEALDGPKHLVQGTWQGAIFDEDGNRAGEISAVFGRSGDGPVNEIHFEDIEGNVQVFEVSLDLTDPPEPDMPFGFASVGGGVDSLLTFSGQFTRGTEDDQAMIEGTLTLIPASEKGKPQPKLTYVTGSQGFTGCFGC